MTLPVPDPHRRDKPMRLQLSRRKGFDLQAWSREINGLSAINVARPSKWGNPYKIVPAVESDYCRIPAIDAASAVHLFREHWRGALAGAGGAHRCERLKEISGRNLACWCAPNVACHADMLLELANIDAPEAQDHPPSSLQQRPVG